MPDADDDSPGTARTVLGIGDDAPTANLHGKRRGPPPLVVPGYRVLELLGEGGMGAVYAAEQESPRRRVAIKVLQSRSQSAWVRFQNEAQVMARLDHPGIARVLESGEADGQPFLVMEHVDGVTLERHVKGLARTARLELFVAICDAVHHAHLKGVIHRDLKPANVMVRDGNRVVVLDFGVARLAEGDGTHPGQTRAGELIGTPLYMSPEQARLRADEVDARTDVYTLGVILYELACDDLPYEAKDAPIPILTCAICEDPAIPLGKRDPALRGDLDAIAMKALAKEPAERYQSVAALGDDVRRYLQRLPVSVRSPGSLERLRRFVRRRPLVAAAIGGTLAAAATFAVVITVLWRDASAARATAEDARGRTERARAELEARTNQLVLRQARAALARDPTQAVAWLATLTPRDVDPGTAWAIADEALARGVARDVLHGHADEVHWVEGLTGGFVSGGYDGRVIVWDPSPRGVFTAKHGRIHAVRPSPDGAELAIGGDEGQLHVVARDGRVVGELVGHAGDVQHLAWSPDGAWLATGDDHGHVWLWPRGRTPGKQLEGSAAAIGDLAFSASGHELVAGDHEGAVWRWDLATGTRVVTNIKTDVVELWTDGPHVAAVDGVGTVHVWHVADGGLALDRETKTGLNTKRAVFAPGGGWAVLGGVGGAVTRVEGAVVESLGTHRTQVRSLAISDDGRWIATGSDDGALVVRDRTTGRELALRGHTGRIRHVAFVGGELLSSDSDGVVRRWQVAAMPPSVLDARGAPAERLAASPDGKRLAAVDSAGEVSLWTVADASHVTLGHVDGRVTALAFAGGTVVTGTAEGALTWWAQPVVHQPLHGIVKSIAVTRDRVAVATSAGPIAMFTLAGTPLPALAGHPGGSDAVAFDPGGELMMSGGQDRVIRIWHRGGETFAPVAALDGPRGDTHFVAFTPGGEAAGLAIAAGNDGVVHAWTVRGPAVDATSHRLIAAHTGAVTALAVAPGWIASAGRDLAIARVRVTGVTTAEPEHAELAAAAVALVFDGDGGLHAVTRAGEGVRWPAGAPPVIEIDHGLLDGTRVDAAHLALAYEDGALVIVTPRARALGDLPAALARATSFTLAQGQAMVSSVTGAGTTGTPSRR